jgi:hypothetical protein
LKKLAIIFNFNLKNNQFLILFSGLIIASLFFTKTSYMLFYCYEKKYIKNKLLEKIKEIQENRINDNNINDKYFKEQDYDF